VKNGYKIEFSVFPNYFSFLPEIQFSTEKAEIVTAEVSKLLAKGAIKKVFAVDGQFISNLFLVPKKDGTLRPVINLKNIEFIC
jgi:hypothetical protein